jgi:hypothetical protein
MTMITPKLRIRNTCVIILALRKQPPAGYRYNSAGDVGGLSTGFPAVYFNGVDSYHAEGIFNNAGTLGHGEDLGIYTVTADGALTLSSYDGKTFTGGVSADGNTLVTAQVTSQQPPYFAVTIKDNYLP